MAYPPRRTPARKYPAKKSVYKKSLKPARQALPVLARQVAQLKREVKGTSSTVMYSDVTGNNVAIGNAGGTNVYIRPLSQYANWSPIFGTDADDASNHSALWKKSNFDFEIDADQERNSIDYSFYIVSLTKLGMEELFTASTGGLAGPLGITSLTNGTHYQQIVNNVGLAFLNRKYFNILHCRRIITGTGGSVAYETASLRKRWYVKMSHNKGQGHRLQNPKGDWKSLASPQLAAQNMYVLIFNNDSTADATVKFKMNAIHSVDIA